MRNWNSNLRKLLSRKGSFKFKIKLSRVTTWESSYPKLKIIKTKKDLAKKQVEFLWEQPPKYLKVLMIKLMICH